VWALLSGCGTFSSPPSNDPEAHTESIALTVLAASSLTDVLPKVADAFGAGREDITLMFSFDSSSRLVKQLEGGAPADLLFTADTETMAAAAERGLITGATRRDLLGNVLVLVVPAGSEWTPVTTADLASSSLKHLAIAGENVPAGKYGRAALESAGVWTSIESRIVRGDNVRTTLGWVTRGEADAGIVYATDARTEPAVRVALTFPAESHPPIVYPAAVVTTSAHPEEAAAFLAFCASADAMALFAEAGFTPPPAPAP
jgi:molybdate transport system substrate-binding protein